jgi:hypothetical protein
VIHDIREASGSSMSVAHAHVTLATHLREHPQVALDPSEMTDNLYEAIRHYDARGHRDEATECLRQLRAGM